MPLVKNENEILALTKNVLFKTHKNSETNVFQKNMTPKNQYAFSNNHFQFIFNLLVTHENALSLGLIYSHIYSLNNRTEM